MLVPRAQLRVFAPLEAFEERERTRWRRYVDAGGGLTRAQLAAAERRLAVASLLGRPLTVVADGALVRRMGDRVLVCPLQPELRAAAALASFRLEIPREVHGAFSSGTRAIVDGPDRAPQVLDAPWRVPLAWFVAFAPGERRFTDPPEGSGPRVVHLTTIARARDRLATALDVLAGALEDAAEVVDPLTELEGWLEGFHPDSLLELDFGGLAGLLGRGWLRTERTCEDLWRALRALEDGDPLEAAAAYGTARSRWSDASARRSAS